MHLSRDSKLVRFSYFFFHNGPPEQTTLCAFFWRTFVLNPIVLLAAATAIAGVVFMFGHAIFLIVSFLGFFYSLALILFVVGLAIWRPTVKTPVVATVFWHGLKATKSKFCPIIELR